MSYDRNDDDDEDDRGADAPAEVAELANSSVPTNLKSIRACKRCGILKTSDQFLDDGCENCPFLSMVDDMQQVNKCTTAFFEGTAAVMDPRESWAAKWIRVDSCLPGVYAISVTGSLDPDIEAELADRGIRWRCRPHQS